MSGKSNKSKKPKQAPKKEVPKKTVEEEVPLQATEDVLIEETEVAAEPAKEAKPAKAEQSPKKGKASGKGEPEKAAANKSDSKKDEPKKDEPKKKASGPKFKLRDVDPIILVSSIVFFAACIAVVGMTIYDVTLADHSTRTCEYGDSVVVDYTGSYFNYYDRDGTVFDTSLESVTNDSNIKKSYEFTAKSTFSTINFKIGDGSYLAKFENCLINHHVGDTVRVTIPAADGYGALTESQKGEINKTGQTIAPTGVYTAAQFRDLFGFDAPAAGVPTDMKGPYGWDVSVMVGVNGMVTVDYTSGAVVGQTYAMNAKVSTKVTDKTGQITFDYVLGNFNMDKDMAKIIVNGDNVYAIKSTDTKITYKTTDEKVGATLFFVIKFVSFK